MAHHTDHPKAAVNAVIQGDPVAAVTHGVKAMRDETKVTIVRRVTRFVGHLLGEAIEGTAVAFGLKQFFPSLTGKEEKKPEEKPTDGTTPPSIKTEENLRGFGDEQLMLKELLMLRNSSDDWAWHDQCDEFLAWHNQLKAHHRQNLRRGYIAEKNEANRLSTLERLIRLTNEQRDAIVEASGFLEKTSQEQAVDRVRQAWKWIEDNHAAEIAQASADLQAYTDRLEREANRHWWTRIIK